MKKFLLAALLLATPVQAKTILFVGNSFTYGAGSPAHHYKTESVTDLNGPDAKGKLVGGVPAIFKAFTRQAGLEYDVSLETVGGKGLEFHYAEKRALLDKPWDVVVMHGYSTLDQANPGNPALLVSSAKQITDMFRARNPKAEIWLTATWSRADQTYPAAKPWTGKPIAQMGKDVAAGYAAAATSANVTGVVPVGLAWNRAFETGVADANPYDGIARARSICGPTITTTPASMAITWKRCWYSPRLRARTRCRWARMRPLPTTWAFPRRRPGRYSRSPMTNWRHHASAESISSAASTVARRISVRPTSPNSNTRCVTAPSWRAAAICTSPTGLASVPPPGPAMPVTATERLACECSSAPWAMARATSSDTAPCRSSRLWRTPSMSCLASLE